MADDDDAFVRSTLARIDAAHEARQLDHVRAALAPRTVRMRTAVWGLVAAAALATFATWGLARVFEPEQPMAFGVAVPSRTSDDLTRDALGRIAAIDGPDGERLVFRAGRLARVERWKDGVLDGVVVDFDARGHVAAVRHWRAGEERGPWIEMDEYGRVRASGER